MKHRDLLFLSGDAERGSRWLGLEEILIERAKRTANIPQLCWLRFMDVSCCTPPLLPVKGGQNFSVHRAS